MNRQVANDRKDIEELNKDIREKERKVKLTTGFTTISTAFENNTTQIPNGKPKVHHLKDFSMAIERKALNKLRFYRFNNLQHYFPHLASANEFITSDKYLNPIKILFTGTEEQVNNPTAEMKLEASVKALDEIAKEIQAGSVEYKGTKSFTPQGVGYTFKDKTLNITVGEGNAEYGIPQSTTTNSALQLDLSKVDWYAFNENYGTDQEEVFSKIHRASL